MKLKTIILFAFFSSTTCLAEEMPNNSQKIEIQNNRDLLSVETIYQIPSATYEYLDSVFTRFYKKVSFQTDIADSTFTESSHYEWISLPLIAENNKGIQLELFGNLSDPQTQRFSNYSEDQALSDYYAISKQFDINNSELSLGAGFSFNTSKDSKIKVIISTNDIPGYGSSNALFGFETTF